MARRCLCARLLAALHEDPRLRTLPLATRMLFLLLAEAAAASPVSGVLPFRETRRVSLLVSASETDVEPALETLLAEGLLAEDAGGGLAVPLLMGLPPRGGAAKRNGARGGRPRKGETPEAAYARRQADMLLPLPGGAVAAAKPSETQSVKLVSSTTSNNPVVSKSAQEGESSARGAETPEWVSLGAELAELAGMDGARGGFNFRPVQAWLAQGIPANVIRAAVTEAVGRKGYEGRRVYSLTYFARAVAALHEGGGAGIPKAVPVTADDRARMRDIEAENEAFLRRQCRGVVAA